MEKVKFRQQREETEFQPTTFREVKIKDKQEIGVHFKIDVPFKAYEQILRNFKFESGVYGEELMQFQLTHYNTASFTVSGHNKFTLNKIK